ncbi:myosin light chain kinase family member 4 [Eurytemora carolleeae]|uniref:myosin light chain kinase family member 4 n=1 Tax=Eurytemora carolleeae TaxID=1294199 RepID=UPI000C75C183|nr:myosin light chain kinase family member 4 [Eurytemora carolleeae]|eukprot:XP_023328356.1 myosin light chain kinase family member 4-like [Eurytemora affinis]
MLAAGLKGFTEYEEEYTVLEALGKGKFGVVYKVEDRSRGIYAAAKHIKTRTQHDRNRVMEEIEILESLKNPFIIQFYQGFESRKEMIVVTEYLDGGELFDRVASQEYILTEDQCSSFIRRICKGLEYLHQALIVHLDLKPENIVCINRSSTDIKIIDFGLAKKLLPTQEIKVMCGTPEFLAPEVLNFDPISFTTDMWAVGVITYILVSGLSPFLGDSDHQTFANIIRNNYTFEDTEFEGISENAKVGYFKFKERLRK